MGDAVFGSRLVAGSGFDPHPKSDAFEMWHSFRDNGQPGRKPGQIYSHTQRLSASLFAGACMFADEAFHGFELRIQNVETPGGRNQRQKSSSGYIVPVPRLAGISV